MLVSNGSGLLLHDVAADGRLLLERTAFRAGMLCLSRGEQRERELAWLDRSVAEVISNDGTVVLFSEFGEAADPKEGVFLRKTDGSPAIRLGDGISQGLSSDGRWALAWKAGSPAELALLPTGAGTARKIPVEGVDPLGAFLLPNGKGLLVGAVGKKEPVELSLVGLDGGKPRQIHTEDLLWDGGGTVSPDGENLVYVARGGTLKIVPLSGGQTRTVPGRLSSSETPPFSGAPINAFYLSRRAARSRPEWNGWSFQRAGGSPGNSSAPRI